MPVRGDRCHLHEERYVLGREWQTGLFLSGSILAFQHCDKASEFSPEKEEMAMVLWLHCYCVCNETILWRGWGGITRWKKPVSSGQPGTTKGCAHNIPLKGMDLMTSFPPTGPSFLVLTTFQHHHQAV